MPLIATVLAMAAAPPETPLPPTGPWGVEVSDSMCILKQHYRMGRSDVTVAFQPMFRMDRMELIVLVGDQGGSQEVGDAMVEPSPGGGRLRGRYFSVPVKEGKFRYTRITVNRSLFDNLANTRALTIRAQPLRVSVAIPQATKALAAFNKCQDDLLAYWGVDPATMTDERAPKPLNIGTAFTSSDYPMQAIREGAYGRAVAVVQVTAEGTASACRIVATAGKLLNDATCAGAMHIRFKPGVDASGRPAVSAYVLAIRWAMPGTE